MQASLCVFVMCWSIFSVGIVNCVSILAVSKNYLVLSMYKFYVRFELLCILKLQS